MAVPSETFPIHLPPEKPISMAPQILMMPAVNKIFLDTTSGKGWTNRTQRKISMTGVNRATPGNIGHSYEIIETSSQDLIVIIGNTVPPCGPNVSSEIDNIRQSATPYLRNSNKLDTSIDRQFTNNLNVLPIFTEIFGGKLSNSSSQYLCIRFWMNLTTDPVNIPAPPFLNLYISTIKALEKGTSLWTPNIRVGRPNNVAYWSVPDHFLRTYSGWRRCELKVRL